MSEMAKNIADLDIDELLKYFDSLSAGTPADVPPTAGLSETSKAAPPTEDVRPNQTVQPAAQAASVDEIYQLKPLEEILAESMRPRTAEIAVIPVSIADQPAGGAQTAQPALISEDGAIYAYVENDIAFDVRFRGYDTAQVEHYIDAFTKDYNRVCAENDDLRKENEGLRKSLVALQDKTGVTS